MPTRSILLPGALACALLLAALGLVAGPKDKEPAPRFNATTTGGEKFSNDSIKGKVVLLEFWTTWCGYCADEAGFVDKIGHDYADKGLILLAIDVGESKKTVKKYLEQHPRACDDLIGIARWWLLRQRIEVMTTEVKGAIDELVRLGLLVRTSRSHGQPLYSLSKNKNSHVAGHC